MNRLINLNTVSFDQRFRCIIVALRFDALYFHQQLTKQRAQCRVILDVEEGLSVAIDFFYDSLGFALLEAPIADPSSVPHVRLFNVCSQFQATQL